MFEKVDFEDEIDHLFVVDIMFDLKNATKRQLVYNEIYPPIIEKNKIIDPCVRSIFHSLEQYKGDNDNPLAYRTTSKAHTTMLKKKIFPCI